MTNPQLFVLYPELEQHTLVITQPPFPRLVNIDIR